MKNKFYFCWLFLSLLFLPTLGRAEIIHLKNGQTIEGTIVEENEKEIKINMRGVVLSYDADEIESKETGSAIGRASSPQSLPSQPSVEVYSPTSTSSTPTLVPATPSSTKPIIERGSSADFSDLLSKEELILNLIAASGTKENMNKLITNLMSQVPAQEAQALQSMFNVDEIMAQLIPIYSQYFTDSELKELTLFYKSPLGRKLLEVTPKIMQDSTDATAAYFQNKMRALGAQ